MKSALTSKLCLFLRMPGGLRDQGVEQGVRPEDLHRHSPGFKLLSPNELTKLSERRA